VNTVGGIAPTTGCDSTTVGATQNVPYTADYYFFAPDMTGCATWNTPPTVPAGIAVPAGATVAMHAAASGTQNYQCTATTSGTTTTYAWAFIGPDATLSSCTGATIGHHLASPGGPTAPEWDDTDGSTVIASRTAGATVDATAVPWLLLTATSTSGTGVLTPVQYIQRVNTVGGIAPTTTCDATNAGTTVGVNYTADYFFYMP
jgi:hypothetical protein